MTVVEAAVPRSGGAARRYALALGSVAGAVGLAQVGVATATHTVITANDTTLSPTISNGQPANGWYVYLSSPRHDDSGSRGECGWEENINGRHFNYYAMAGNYYNGTPSPNHTYRNLVSRGYKTNVGANAQDGRWWDNRTSGNNWGADVYIITHTNAYGGCDSSPDYSLIMDRSHTQSQNLSDKLETWVDSLPLGVSTNRWPDTNSENNSSNSAPYRSYVELFFHDNQDSVDWFEGGTFAGGIGVKYAYIYGVAVDMTLGYPGDP